MTLVLDASVAMTWCFEDETTAYSEAVLQRVRDEGAVAPAVWPLELVNTLLVGERNGRHSAEHSMAFLRLISELPISIESLELEETLNPVAALGREHRLSSYDASYVWLAMKEGLSLATLDQRVRRACERIGVSLVI